MVDHSAQENQQYFGRLASVTQNCNEMNQIKLLLEII